jgi:carboxypeptidase Taq
MTDRGADCGADCGAAAYAALLAFQRETEALALIAGRLAWDQETVMPRGAATQRGEEMAAIEGVLHARRSDPRVADWLAAARSEDDAAAALLRRIAREHRRATRVPARLAQEIARVTSLAQGIWAEARAQEDIAGFLPMLGRVVALRREEAACLAAGGDLYDALLDDHEPAATGAAIAVMFAAMRPRLVALRQAVLERPPAATLAGHFPAAGQIAVARDLASLFGYDWTRGRLDLAVHPFASGAGDDVRITTRVNEADPLNCLYATIHEVGHATYEQRIDRAFALTPLGHGASMGLHESQSRLFENQLGRSRGFTGWLFARMQREFGHAGAPDAETFHRAVNVVRPGFIRTEADELHYNLHIMLRFDLERALIVGDLAVADLEAAWNDRFAADFGVAVDRPSHGMLQDVHWAIGLFGYFPTYSLGNVFAGCLHAALVRDLPDLEARLAAGDAAAATGWLAEHVQRHGARWQPETLVERACGHPVSPGPLLDYLEAKFGALYGL